jgi:hypothetical protein
MAIYVIGDKDFSMLATLTHILSCHDAFMHLNNILVPARNRIAVDRTVRKKSPVKITRKEIL